MGTHYLAFSASQYLETPLATLVAGCPTPFPEAGHGMTSDPDLHKQDSPKPSHGAHALVRQGSVQTAFSPTDR